MTQALGRDLGDEALDLAQEKAFEAMEARTKARRITLAREALAISPLCADAYGVLAGEAATPAEALELHRRAVEAGAQALGDEIFTEDAGQFWGLIETRPYMRARQSLACMLWAQDAKDEAVTHFQDLLRLNPNDNQGIRYLLLDSLLELGRDAQAADLMKRYEEDDSAAWAWSAALLSFRQTGASVAARKALARAAKLNRHVLPYLLAQTPLPAKLPAYYSPGDASEAVGYVCEAEEAWRRTEGALQWAATALASGAREGRPSADDAPKQSGAEATSAEERIDDAVLALLLLGLHDGNRTWKTFDRDVLDRLHARSLIEDSVDKAEAVAFTPTGIERARVLYDALFGPAVPGDLTPPAPASGSPGRKSTRRS